MILKGAGVCPLIKIGDVVKGETVTDLVCDRASPIATCRAFRALAMIRFGHGHDIYDYMHPLKVSWVNCNECPILIKDPNHYRKTKWRRELVQDAEATVQEPTEKGVASLEHKDHNRFQLIDISDEEEQNGKSSCNPNQ